MDRTLSGSTLWHGQRSECADLSELLLCINYIIVQFVWKVENFRVHWTNSSRIISIFTHKKTVK